MTPNVTNTTTTAPPAGSNWNLPATRVSGAPSAGAPASAPVATSGQLQDTIEIGRNSANGANGSNGTTLPSLAVITQRIISEIRIEAKNEQKKTDERRAQDENDLRENELRQQEQQAEERKQLAQKLDQARQDQSQQARPQPRPADRPRTDPVPAPQGAKPGDPSNPTILHTQEIQAQAATITRRPAAVQPPPDLTPPPEAAAPAPTPKFVSPVSFTTPPRFTAPSPPPRPPESNPGELLHTITSQLHSSSLNEISSVHLLSVNFQS